MYNLDEFMKNLEYRFKNDELLKTALTHSSYANENKSSGIQNNERLEFLGDSVLNLIITNYIYTNYPDMPEGEMTKIRASVVCESTLKDISVLLKIGEVILLGKGENTSGGRNRPSILSDAFEAILGAIYLDGGFEIAKSFVLKFLADPVNESVKGIGVIDYKTRLQELLQKNGDVSIHYEVIDEVGPDHNKEFHVQVKRGDKLLGKGIGRSKKEAEQNSAKHALESLNDK